MQHAKLFAYVNNIQITWKTIYSSVNGRFRVETTELRRVHILSLLLCDIQSERNHLGQLGIRNRIEYLIFYLFLVNIIGNCHENKYI
jgi:hypothetical protein